MKRKEYIYIYVLYEFWFIISKVYRLIEEFDFQDFVRRNDIDKDE